MGKIFDAVTTFLKEDGWPIRRIGKDLAYSVTFEGENGEWACIAQVVEEENLFLFYSACPVEAPEAQRPAVAELLSRLNFNLKVGDFEMDFADGHIRYRTSIDITGHTLGALLINQVVYTNVLTMDRYLPLIKAVIQGSMSPGEAAAAARNLN
jgi:hypothetical protein